MQPKLTPEQHAERVRQPVPHVQQHAAARLVHIPEPVAVRAEVFFALLDEEDAAKCPFVHQLLGPDILGGEAQLLGIHQQHARLATGGNHLVGLVQ